MKPDLLLAALLLTSPPGVPESPPHPDVWPAVRDGLHQVAVEWQIMDPREVRYVFSCPECYGPDLDMLRRRRVELADAPRVEDGWRLPPREYANTLIRFNRAVRKSLDERQQLEPDRAAAIQAAIRETDRLYRPWDLCRDATCEFYYVTVRRKALKDLRDAIGPDAYAAGELPPNVPTWRFNELK